MTQRATVILRQPSLAGDAFVLLQPPARKASAATPAPAQAASETSPEGTPPAQAAPASAPTAGPTAQSELRVPTPAASEQPDIAAMRRRAYKEGHEAGLAQGTRAAQDEIAQAQARMERAMQMHEEALAGREQQVAAAEQAICEHQTALGAQAGEVTRALALADAARSGWVSARDEMLANAEDELAALCTELAAQLFGETVVQPALLHGLVQRALAVMGECARPQVHLHPEDMAWLRSALDTRTLASDWHWVADASMLAGGCAVRSGHAGLDARLDTLLRDFVKRVQDLRAARRASTAALAPAGEGTA